MKTPLRLFGLKLELPEGAMSQPVYLELEHLDLNFLLILPDPLLNGREQVYPILAASAGAFFAFIPLLRSTRILDHIKKRACIGLKTLFQTIPDVEQAENEWQDENNAPFSIFIKINKNFNLQKKYSVPTASCPKAI